MPIQSSLQRVELETHEPLQPEEQASARVTAWPYLTQDGSVEVKMLGTEVGSSIQLSLNTRHQNPATKNQITHVTILGMRVSLVSWDSLKKRLTLPFSFLASLVSKVLSKGQIVYAKHQLKKHGSVYTSAIIDVTSETLPSFRILAFYLLPRAKGQDPELVADSIWIDMNDRCMGTLKAGLKNEGPFQPLEPNRQEEVKVIGSAEATVRLVAVDKAVYVLNSKHKPTQKKVWDVVEEHDIGCTVGSGKDRLAVFNDAGLDLRMSRGIDTLASSGLGRAVSPTATFHRCSLKRLGTKRSAGNKFKMELARKCREAGLPESPAGLAYEERTCHGRRQGAGACLRGTKCHGTSQGMIRAMREWADEDEDFGDIFMEDQPVPTLFPESWLWRKFTLPKSKSGSLSYNSTLVTGPDSITTWQFVAVSLKAGQGLCVSDPSELTVMKSFLVDLKLPSSVVRDEQVQIQAVLYNFSSRQVKVKPEPSPAHRPSVSAGGQIQQISHRILLNPQGLMEGGAERQDFLNKVPNTEAEMFVSVQGNNQRFTSHPDADGTYHTSKGNLGGTWLTSYVLRVFALVYSTMTTRVSLAEHLGACQGHAGEVGESLSKTLGIMGVILRPQGGYRGSEADISLTALVPIALDEGKEPCSRKIQNLTTSMERARSFLEKWLPQIQTTFAVAIVSYALALTESPRANDRLDSFASRSECGPLLNQLCVTHSHGGQGEGDCVI
ncbi:complement c3-like [Lynx pardinus]|nr:complement c3-like [Lynx pardinus]